MLEKYIGHTVSPFDGLIIIPLQLIRNGINRDRLMLLVISPSPDPASRYILSAIKTSKNAINTAKSLHHSQIFIGDNNRRTLTISFGDIWTCEAHCDNVMPENMPGQGFGYQEHGIGRKMLHSWIFSP